MSDGSDAGGGGHGRRPPPRAVGAELVLPIAAVLYGGYYIYTIWGMPLEAQINGFFITGILFALVAVFLVRVGLERARGAVTLRLDGLLEPVSLLPRRIAFFLLTLASLVLLPWLGFTLTTFLFMLASMLALGIDSRRALLTIATATALGGYVFFIAILDTRFPRGPVERLLAWVF